MESLNSLADRYKHAAAYGRVGAHRANSKIGSPKMAVLFAFLAFLLLATSGIIFIQLQPGSVNYGTGEGGVTGAAPVAKVEGVVDPQATVVVLNGTTIDDLAYFVDDEMMNNGWGKIVFSGPNDSDEVSTSAVFYADPEDEAAAVGLGEKLGGIKAYLGPQYVVDDNRLTVLLGADYQGPGLEQAKSETHSRLSEQVQEETESVEPAEPEISDDEFVDEELYFDEYYEE